MHDRSYIVETEDGGVYRRNRGHLLKTNEKPLHIFDPQSLPISENHKNITHSDIQQPQQQQQQHQQQKQQQLQQNASVPKDSSNRIQADKQYVTRSGRTVKPPQRTDL
ncbi:hypothetical protein DPMN_118717 [Dreissena polymorpha]|uniref:Uncharacterized protein n=1 Tax=Dreissena polymorpha TaxID=45954 RepID=A0A9D4GNL5_DREPO|nr:hypothetical protein DPMN_118717 [Dreissena polymorpha]